MDPWHGGCQTTQKTITPECKKPSISILGFLHSGSGENAGAVTLCFFFSADTAAETLGEAIDTTTSINHFLLASIERVALAAHVYMEVST